MDLDERIRLKMFPIFTSHTFARWEWVQIAIDIYTILSLNVTVLAGINREKKPTDSIGKSIEIILILATWYYGSFIVPNFNLGVIEREIKRKREFRSEVIREEEETRYSPCSCSGTAAIRSAPCCRGSWLG